MELGAFSVSLAVKDMAASRTFYSKLGFEMFGGNGEAWHRPCSNSFSPG
jgi:catechol 2,3-dioxygenase-like lactoylglutathione lyase family enzyme